MQAPFKFVVILAAAAVAIAARAPAQAQDADTQEVMRYTLTEAGLAKYSKAVENLTALPGGVPGNCESDDDADSNSIADLVARLNASPGAKGALQSAGLSAREYIVFSMSLLQNGLVAWGLTQPGGKLPPGVSKANVDFVNAHGPQLKKLEQVTKKGDCGGDDDDSTDD